jgi:DDE superfamily endonuclease
LLCVINIFLGVVCCLLSGALDGKHVRMTSPNHSGAVFRNYKGTFSIVLMGLVDARYRFLYVDVGTNGRVSDGGVFNNCSLGHRLEDNTLCVPPPSLMPNTTTVMPYYIVADDAFALKTYLMKPYPFRNMSPEQRIFNYRLSRARRIVENAFGIISQKFRCLRTDMILQPDCCESIVLACCALHNTLLARNDNVPNTEVDFEDTTSNVIRLGDWYQDAAATYINLSSQTGSATRYSQTAKAVRDSLCQYVNSSEGSVPWQDAMVF